MGEIKIVMPDDLERVFRKVAMKRFGFRKGSMSEAAREAIENWSIGGDNADEQEDSWNSLEGCMKHVKKSSVQLQHEAWNSVIEKHSKKSRKKYANRH